MPEHVNQHPTTAEDLQFDPRADSEALSADSDKMQEPEDELQILHRDLEDARREAFEANDKYLRTRADMENYKKRLERTYSEKAEYEKKALLTKLLGVKDNLERALQYSESSQGGEGITEGVRLTQYQLDNLLQQEGVRSTEAEGKPFDPHTEEAIQSVNDPTIADHTVVKVVRTGYAYGDSVLRPAQVIVNVHADSGE